MLVLAERCISLTENAVEKRGYDTPSFLYGGYPCKDLRHKFLMAQESSGGFSDASFRRRL